MKTISDSNAGEINFSPQTTTVDTLRALAKPSSYPDNSRVGSVERMTFTVQAMLLKMKREDDRDIHLVIADPTDASHTMIVEFPDVACEGAISSPKKAEMQTARQAFEAACGVPTSSFRDLVGSATITGVGFFDVIHGQTGVAPNGIELHPVLAVSNITCTSAGATSTPTATSTSPGATATPTRTPPSTSTTQSFSVPACYVAGQDACNCSNFTTHAWAQWFHDTYDPSDVNKLDADHDGLVCESLP